MRKPTAKHTGTAGERWVAQQLSAQGWTIVAVQWRCRWGELDVVARDRDTLLFVEVKTRQAAGIDSNGLAAVTPRKQGRLVRAAAEFLGRHPDLADLACRFDVAAVRVRVADGQPYFVLQHYCPDAFPGEITIA